ncbi:hypothetical protein [Brevundimonas lenta]|uniref:Uncharacterized protein n=1 Tax=Brevundimonas lenta TaxID=424796 RepID=A0A7W6NMI0_9CAUL|nr:hypothetical protein [Brevundimonas lenta]MBB4081375.1 hypothetical protein [Brevundimonas lenta]
MTPDPTPNHPSARLLAALRGVDLTSADGRAGIGALLAEIERLSPGAIQRQSASMDLRRAGSVRQADGSA